MITAKLPRRALMLAAGCLLGLSQWVFAEDPVQVAPDNYKVLFENELIRVLEARYGPGETTVMHQHPRNLVVAMSDGLSRPLGSDGKTAEYKFRFGDVIWREELEHIGTNSSDQEMYIIMIEFKTQDQ